MKTKSIAYWTTTALFSIAIAASGLAKLTGQPALVEGMQHLGYPLYLMDILGVWYLLAAATLVAPGLPRLKEWAYAGVSFALSGAFISHLASGDSVAAAMPTLALLALALTSWALRPESRRLASVAAVSDEPEHTVGFEPALSQR